MKQAELVNFNGEVLGKVDLPEEIFSLKINPHLIHESFIAHMSSQRRGTASVKTRKDVSGGGAKPWKQKGTGRARAGSIRSPIWRGGGVAFGPHPRSYYVSMPKKKRQAAIKQLLSSKAKEGKLKVIDEINLKEPKTKIALQMLGKNNLKDKKTLIIVDKITENLKRAFSNIPDVLVSVWKNLNVFVLLKYEYILISKTALDELSTGFTR